MPLPTPLSQHIVRRPQRIALLQHIDEQGSITRAAKAAGMSYKAAWDAIDELNNLAARPLVERSTGGRGGGGARLSDEGRRVLRLYQRLQILQAQILEEAEDSSDLDLLGRLMLRTSARNQLHGRVSAIHPQGRNDTIELTLAGDLRIEAQITHDSTHRLELEPGTAVVALIKAGWLELATRDAPVPQGTNSLEATIDEWLDDPQGSSELRLSLGSGQILCAFAEPEWLRSHDLAVGSVVQVRFLPTYVLLGTPV
ncbi:TOBE-like domain-containing protein [Pseudomonas putida]|nr:TOBE domain-containing protein [Pseudomonas putida]